MPLLDSSVRLYTELIDLIIKTPQNLRYDTLNLFAKRHGLSYDQVKRRAEILAYATRKETLSKVPKSIRQDVRNVMYELASGRISLKEADEASINFLSKTPLMDVERLNRDYKSEDEEILGMQLKIAKNAETMMQRMIKTGVHPVRAYSVAWSMIGRKLHYEIPKTLERVPKENIPEVIKDVWRVNFKKSQASLQYETARLDYLDMLKGFKRQPASLRDMGPHWPIAMPAYMKNRNIERNADAIAQRLESDRKNLQRFSRPGAERAFPRDIKRIAIEEYKFHKNEDWSKIRDPFKIRIMELGRRLHSADVAYHDAKQLEEEKVSPFVQISRKKRRFRA
jgi:hypothetical protein